MQVSFVTSGMELESQGEDKALLISATGDRVIIVMGASSVVKQRVSGTLNKYISCIA